MTIDRYITMQNNVTDLEDKFHSRTYFVCSDSWVYKRIKMTFDPFKLHLNLFINPTITFHRILITI